MNIEIIDIITTYLHLNMRKVKGLDNSNSIIYCQRM